MAAKHSAHGQKQDFVYAGKTQTRILLEQPSEQNPYICQKSYLHGYDTTELIAKTTLVQSLLLLFTGELPTSEQAQLFERLMIALINLGPRHPAVKASMVAGVSKSNAEHLLPIGLSVLGGKENGALEVAAAVDFIYQHKDQPVEQVVKHLLTEHQQRNDGGELHICPGFGQHYGGIDELTRDHAKAVITPWLTAYKQDNSYLAWGAAFDQALHDKQMGMLRTGLAALVFCQLGIAAREATGLYQLLCAPGIFAHGVEQTHKPITAMPMLADEQHVYRPQVSSEQTSNDK